MNSFNLQVLTLPNSNGYTAAGLYLEDRPGICEAVFCQITGRACMIMDDDGLEGTKDCRTCNIPIVAAICRLSQTIGANGRE